MIDESMELTRKAKPGEEKLLDLLIGKSAQAILPIDWKDNLLVQPMNDGDMGSLRCLKLGKHNETVNWENK